LRALFLKVIEDHSRKTQGGRFILKRFYVIDSPETSK